MAFGSLQKGMVPLESISRAEDSGPGSPAQYVRSDEAIPGSEVLCEAGVPIDEKQCGVLRKLSLEGTLGPPNDTLAVRNDLPYAPFLALSVCVSSVCGGSILRILALM